MKYFEGFAPAFDPPEVDEKLPHRPADPGAERLPYDLLDPRRFETLAYRLKLAEAAVGDRVTPMQGVGERGRDVIVHDATGTLKAIVQCKRLDERMDAREVKQELLKLAIHGALEPAILGASGIEYEIWSPRGFSETARLIFAEWPRCWNEAELRADATKVMSTYKRFANLRWETVSAFVVETFPKLVRLVPVENVDLTPRVRAHATVYRAFFGGGIYVEADAVAPAVGDVVEERFRRVLAEAGGGTAFDDDPLLDPCVSTPTLRGPAALLNARHRVVGFAGRDALLQEMVDWCLTEGGVRVRLLHAPGGMGKTRFLSELCDRMRANNWRAGFLTQPGRVAELLDDARPALVAIDYAESLPELRDTLKRMTGAHRNKALRLVLLARNAEDWWTYVVRSDSAVGEVLRGEQPFLLEQVAQDRRSIFQEAAEAFAFKLGKDIPSRAPPSLDDPRYERVLYIHAAALAAVEGREVNIDTLLEDTLDHEERFWITQLRERRHAEARAALPKMRRAVASLTLTGGVATKGAGDALVGDEELALLLHDLYPGRGSRYLGALEPDLLGEALVWRVLTEDHEGAEPLLDRVFEGAGEEAIRTGLTVLGRLSEDHEAAAAWIARVLGRDVPGRAMAALAAARTVGKRTANAALGIVLARALAEDGTLDLAKRFEPELPQPRETVSLREAGLWVQDTLLAHLPPGAEPEERARLLSNRSAWLSQLGRRPDALASSRAAVDVYRDLAKSRPAAFTRELAMSLSNLSTMQLNCGPQEYEAALGSSTEAVRIYRDLVRSDPDTFQNDLAGALNNLANVHGKRREHDAALACAHEAVDIRRTLPQVRRDELLPALATNLSNLSGRQRDSGYYDAAMASAVEAVRYFRELADARPEAFQHDLAMSLTNLSNSYADCRNHEAALACAQEAADIYRKLAKSRPHAFGYKFALSLNNLATRQSESGQPEPALASTEEALDAIWPNYVALPDAFEDETNLIIFTLRARLDALGRPASPKLLQRMETLHANYGATSDKAAPR